MKRAPQPSMADMHRKRFDLDTLRDLAGDKVFARGETYHRDGQVEILALEAGRILARVSGTKDYRTELAGQGEDIGGSCSCPAFEDRGICKHMVAAALAANAAGDEARLEGSGALSRIRDYLRTKSLDSLIDMIVDLAGRDHALFRKLDTAAAAAHTDDKLLEARLRKALDGATRTRGFVDYGEARGWAADVEAVLDVLADLPSHGRAGVALELAVRAIDRIELAIEEIDDSDGRCSELLHRARDIHLAAAQASHPEPVQLARDLFAREMDDPYGTFHGAATHYAEVLGEKGLAEYRRLATDAWERLAPRSGQIRSQDQFPDSYRRLTDILDVFAERDGDVGGRIALRAKDLSSPWRYLELAKFCLSQGREEEALSRAEEGLWIFADDRPDERLVLFAVDLLSKAGRAEDARAHLRRAFEKAPSLALFAGLRALGGDAERDWGLGVLGARLSDAGSVPRPGAADLLIRALTDERLFDRAWAAVGRYGSSMGGKEALARASETTHPREAVSLYVERVDQLAAAGGDRAYAEAVRLVTRMAALRDAAEQSAYVAALRVRFGRKRKFMQLLG